MEPSDDLARALAMPLTSRAFPPGPSRFVNREDMIMTFRTAPDHLREVVTEPLLVTDPVVKFEFIRMPDSTGSGDTTESAQVIPVSFEGCQGDNTQYMFLDDHPLIAGGREVWGFLKKHAKPSLNVGMDTLVGELWYGPLRPAMGNKHWHADLAVVQAETEAPSSLLKVIAHVDGAPRILKIVAYHLTDTDLKGAGTGLAVLDLVSHALAPAAEWLVPDVLATTDILADLTLGLGRFIPDYLA